VTRGERGEIEILSVGTSRTLWERNLGEEQKKKLVYISYQKKLITKVYKRS